MHHGAEAGISTSARVSLREHCAGLGLTAVPGLLASVLLPLASSVFGNFAVLLPTSGCVTPVCK